MSTTITKAYGGRAELHFVKAGRGHYYRVSVPDAGIYNIFQPSVTTVLKMKDKPALVQWAANSVADRLLDLVEGYPDLKALGKTALKGIIQEAKKSWRSEDATTIGSLVHRVLEQSLLTGEAPKSVCADPISMHEYTDDMIAQANCAIEAGKSFFADHHIEVVESEAPRWSAKYGFIGTGDLIAKVDGVLSILDYKTSTAIYPENFLQLAAYQAAYQEEHPEQTIQKRVVVNVRKTGILEVQERDNLTFNEDFVCFRALLNVWRWHQSNTPDWKTGAFTPPPPILGPLDRVLQNAQNQGEN